MSHFSRKQISQCHIPGKKNLAWIIKQMVYDQLGEITVSGSWHGFSRNESTQLNSFAS